MNSKRAYTLLASMLVLMLLGSANLRGSALSANGSAIGPGAGSSGQSSFLQNIQAQQPFLAQGPVSYSGYTEITDNEEKIKLQVPVEWSDIETGPWTFKGKEAGVFVAASGDLANFYATRSQAGVLIGVSHSLARTYNKAGLLGLEKRDLDRQCAYQGRFDFQNQFYVGQYDQFTNCSNTPGVLIFTTASADQKSLIFIRMVVVSEADLQAADTILNTFQVLGDPERDDHHDE